MDPESAAAPESSQAPATVDPWAALDAEIASQPTASSTPPPAATAPETQDAAAEAADPLTELLDRFEKAPEPLRKEMLKRSQWLRQQVSAESSRAISRAQQEATIRAAAEAEAALMKRIEDGEWEAKDEVAKAMLAQYAQRKAISDPVIQSRAGMAILGQLRDTELFRDVPQADWDKAWNNAASIPEFLSQTVASRFKGYMNDKDVKALVKAERAAAVAEFQKQRLGEMTSHDTTRGKAPAAAPRAYSKDDIKAMDPKYVVENIDAIWAGIASNSS